MPDTLRECIPVAHFFDNNYVVPAAVSFYSMLAHADTAYDYKLYVLHTDITSQNQEKLRQVVAKFKNASLEYINMEGRFDEMWLRLKDTGHFAKEVLYKLLLPSIFPNYQKVVLTDVDVVFLGDIAPSYFSFTPEEPVLFAGVHHQMPKGTWLENYYSRNYHDYFGPTALEELKVCGGFLVANLQEQRRRNMEKIFVDYLMENGYRLLQLEQDVINFCCTQNELLALPLEYVLCSYVYDFYSDGKAPLDAHYSLEEIQHALAHPIQLHYATGVKPWNDPLCTKADVWYLYLAKCGMYYDFMRRKIALEAPPVDVIDAEILRKGEPVNTSPLIVSVLCCTYNHGEFIRDTLEGILSQKTEYPFEVIVADDASTDGTQEIIREYQNRYPDKMKKCILRKTNVGIGVNYYEAMQQVSGRFLAICDGDDEWIDPLKIQKQARFLLTHPDYTICCSSYLRHTAGTSKEEDTPFYVNDWIKTSQPIRHNGYHFVNLMRGRFIASCTLMLRWELRGEVPAFFKDYSVIDFPLALLHATCGKIEVMNQEIFARYNTHQANITSEKKAFIEEQALRAIHEVNEYVGYAFICPVQCYMQEIRQWKASVAKMQMGLVPEQEALATGKGSAYERWVPKLFRRIPSAAKKMAYGVKYAVWRICIELVPQALQDKYDEWYEKRKC